MSWSQSFLPVAALVIAVHTAELPSTHGSPPIEVVATFVEASRYQEVTLGSTTPAGHKPCGLWRLLAIERKPTTPACT